MIKKVLLILIPLVVIVASGGYYLYSRTSQVELCEEKLKNVKENHACIATNLGIILVELDPKAAPKSIERLKMLGNDKHFYDNLLFYRVSKDFVVQGGIQNIQMENVGVQNYPKDIQAKLDLTNDKFPTESNFDRLNLSAEDRSAIEQEGFKSDPSLDTKPFGYGSFSFANAGPDTNSTEIFLVTSKDPNSQGSKYLNGRFTNMGRIVEGQNVLDEMNKSKADQTYKYSGEKPTRDIKIYELRVK